jgi:hypothetical protein
VSLGSLLEVLHGAAGSFTTVRATFRQWHHTERSQAAFRAESEEEKRRGVSGASITFQGRGNLPAEQVETFRIWRSADRVREEQHGGHRDGYYGVRDGPLWWSWDQRNGAHSNQDDPSVGSDIGEQMSIMLDPTPLLGTLRFRTVGRSRRADRATILVEAAPRTSGRRHSLRRQALHELGIGADLYRLEVDAEFGVLLSAAALRDGEPFHEVTVLEIAFDEPLGEELFHFEPPPGEEVHSAGKPSHLQPVTPSEAQQRAGFTVLLPHRIPADWQVHCLFSERSVRPPLSACVLVNYRSEDGHESVSLSQYAVGDRPEQYDLMISHGGWQTVTHHGTAVQVRAGGPQHQAHIERDGTFVFLTSETLSADRLGAIAVGLKPARLARPPGGR